MSQSTSTAVADLSPSTSTSSVETGVSTPTLLATPNLDGQIDLGILLQAAHGSWDRLRALLNEVTDDDDKKSQYLFKPTSSEKLHSHQVTKLGKIWNVSLQHKWLEQFPWLSYSPALQEVFVGVVSFSQNSQFKAVVRELEIDQVFSFVSLPETIPQSSW